MRYLSATLKRWEAACPINGRFACLLIILENFMNKTVKRAVLSVSVILVVVGIYCQPFYALYRIRQACRSGDIAVLARYVDFPSVRESIRAQVARRVDERFNALHSKRLDKFTAAVIKLLVERTVDALVSPAGLAALTTGIRQAYPAPEVDAVPFVHEGIPSSVPNPTTVRPGSGYTGMHKFRFAAYSKSKPDAPIILLLVRDGLGWKLSGVDLSTYR